MKKLMTLRQRGYDLLQISLGIAIVLGLMVGGLMLFNQVQTSSEISEVTRNAVAISSEIRAQYRTSATFDSPALTTASILAKSGMNEAMFNNVTLLGAAQTFTVTFNDVNDTVCARLGGTPTVPVTDELGPNSSAVCTAASGENGASLAVTYTR